MQNGSKYEHPASEAHPSLAWRPKISRILGWNFLCIWMGGAPCFMLCSCDSCGGGPSLEGTTFAFGLGDMLEVTA